MDNKKGLIMKFTKNGKTYNNAFPNFIRTKEQRKVRTCFLRQSGLPHLLAERVSSFRDSRQIMFLENNGEFLK